MNRVLLSLLFIVSTVLVACGGGGDAQTVATPSNTWSTSYQYPIPPSTGVTISVSGVEPYTPEPSYQTDRASVEISGENVTFSPLQGITIFGKIDKSGTITLPNRLSSCLDVAGKQIELSSNLSITEERVINGQWEIGAPSANGRCYKFLVNANFSPSVFPGAGIITISP